MKKRFRFLITIPVLLILGSMLFFLFIPYLSEIYLFPRLLHKLPFTEKELSISRLSPWNIRGSLSLADEDRTTLYIPRFELEYTPGNLFKRKVAGLLLDSASLQMEMQDGYPVIRGLPRNDSSLVQEDNTSPLLLPFEIETITFKNCSITLHRGLQKPIRIILDGTFELNFTKQPDNKRLLSALSGQMLTGGDLTLKGDLEFKSVETGYDANLQLKASDISQLTSFLPYLEDTKLSGELTLNGQAHFAELLDHLISFKTNTEFAEFRFSNNNLLSENNSNEKPFNLQLTGTSRKIDYGLANFILISPEHITLDLQGGLEISEKTFNGVGHLFSQRSQSRATIQFAGNNLPSGTEISYELAGDAFNVDDDYSVSSFKADGEITFAGSTVEANLRSIIPEISLKKSEISLINSSLQLPFHYPYSAKDTAGEIKIEEIQYQKKKSGTLSASLLQSSTGIDFSTIFTTPFAPGLNLTCDGTTLLTTDISVRCRFPETEFNSTTIPGFISLPEGLSFNGKLGADGEFHIKDEVPTGKLRVNYKNGTLTHGENKLSDINIGVVFPRLPLLQSHQGQLCTIHSLDFGKIKLSDARIYFRIEDEQSIFLEKIQASWAGGKVETGSFALSTDMKALETTLYCDRLGFTQLLAQFGIDETEGQGSLNGRLPMIINKQGVVFEDGFLFSTPGNSGIVRFNNTRQLHQGMPDINGSAYLDYSMKALENFSYNWAKLSFNSQQDELLIAMQLDGEPADPLPFGYKNGQIVPSSQGPGLQHPIRLDVNFRLPMHDLFQYGKSIQSFMENM
ncbi:MAG: YdbH domain-containing protein [Desulforhopalus sp.]